MKPPTWKKLALLLALGATAPAWAVAPPPVGLTVSTTAPVPKVAMFDRAAVAAHWRTYYIPGMTTNAPPINWTGDAENCAAGDINPAFRSYVLQRLNWYRTLLGAPGDSVFLQELNAKDQAAVLVLRANDKFTHFLDPAWKCYTPEAAEAAKGSNLGGGFVGTPFPTIDQYMFDAGVPSAGHRHGLMEGDWFGYGSLVRAMETGSNFYYDAVYLGGAWSRSVPTATLNNLREKRYYAYPPAGFVPENLFVGWNDGFNPKPDLNRVLYWSFSMHGGDMRNATVSLSDGFNTWMPALAGSSLRQYGTLEEGEFVSSLVWEGPAVLATSLPNGQEMNILPLGPANDRKWTVTISGIVHEGVTRSITYPVYAFNPRDTSVNPVRGAGQTVVEYWHAGLDHYFITADPNEQAFVDGGGAGTWVRTGATFKTGGTHAVCRFYGNRSKVHNGPNSHFYTAHAEECDYVKQIEGWWLESFEAFWTTPATAAGTCPGGTVPIYRAYNDGFARGVDSNHRITPDKAAYEATVARGWKGEGVVMCGTA